MIIEPDLHYFHDGVYRWSPEKAVAAWEESYRRVEQALATQTIRKVVILVGLPGAGKSTCARTLDAADVLVFDGLFVDRARRARVLALAAGVPVEAVWLDVPWDVCVQQNSGRGADRRIPDDVMRQMQQQLEADPPTLPEGFAALQRLSS
jgi:predicted kinase